MSSIQQIQRSRAASLACCEGVAPAVLEYWTAVVGVEDSVDLAGLYLSPDAVRNALSRVLPELSVAEVESAVAGWIASRQNAEVVDIARAHQILQTKHKPTGPSLADIPLRAPRMRNVDLDAATSAKKPETSREICLRHNDGSAQPKSDDLDRVPRGPGPLTAGPRIPLTLSSPI